MSDVFAIGDRVRHAKRPEWGIGTVTRAERLTLQGESGQRVEVRFPNAGLKTLSSIGTELQRVEAPGASHAVNGTFAEREAASESGWLGEITRRKPEEAIVELPDEATDPFRSLRDRIRFTLGLYRFQPVGGKLIDWAVAQTGLDDPLSRFTRQELEQFFARFAFTRQTHLVRLVKEARNERVKIDDLVQAAAPEAQRAVQQLNAMR